MFSVKFYNSENKYKKYKAIFYDGDKKIKTVHFGAKNYEDYTMHNNNVKKQLYIQRHKKNENWDNPLSAGALSRYVLWEKPTLEQGIKFFKNRFNFK